METRRITTLDELAQIAGEVVADCEQNEAPRVIALHGDLGAGKTAFVKEISRILAIQEEVTSPTFGIMKSYHVPMHTQFQTLTHIDAYRIDDVDEMRVLRFQELLEDKARLVCIEWPERIQSVLPQNIYTVRLTLNTDATRDISFGL